ncbi:MAG: hypothetical protein GXY52_09830 [Chloroflexi bacterium]|nr:hypothetical protein [Chloroflexota bacterium]
MRSQVDFSYAFGAPHRVTVAMPDSSHKTLVDCTPDKLWLGWTYQDCTSFPLGALITPRTDWKVDIWPEADGQRLKAVSWQRIEGALPSAQQLYQSDLGEVLFEVVGAEQEALVRVQVRNTSADQHTYQVVLVGVGHHKVPATWDERVPPDHMMCAYNERADRVMVLIEGAQRMPIRRDGVAKTLCLEWTLAPGEEAEGWIVRPYQAYCADMPAWRGRDWAADFTAALQVWRDKQAAMAQAHIPDKGVRDGLYAGLLDFYIMREPVAEGYIAGMPGTEGYRAANAGEPGIVAIALDQFSMHDDAVVQFEMELNQQGEDGNWADPHGWGHTFWACAGFKSWMIREHYLMTRDPAFLERYYPRMLASTRFQERSRARTRVLHADGTKDSTFGLMPRGFGDCGLWDDDDMIGVFLPHNFWSLFADYNTLDAARWLGRPAEEVAEIEAIVNTARTDLMCALEAGVITESPVDGSESYRWIPGVAGKTCGSRWGALNAAVPCGILAPNDELISGTLRYIESNISPGGQPIKTGWLQDGMWVAITLDNVAETHLARGNGEAATRYLYSTLNHATPFYSWCEERGPEPGTMSQTGDRQHLWTPVAVVRATRDMLVLERGEGLELGLGIAPEWLESGELVGISNASCHYGTLSYSIQQHDHARRIDVQLTLEGANPPAFIRLHLPTSVSLAISQTDMTIEGNCLVWRNPSACFASRVQVTTA